MTSSNGDLRSHATSKKAADTKNAIIIIIAVFSSFFHNFIFMSILLVYTMSPSDVLNLVM